MNKKLLKRFLGEEKGQTLVLFALIATFLIGISAFSVDVGYLQWQKRELQNTADAASLAGARALIDEIDVYEEVKKYVKSNGFEENDIVNESEIKSLSSGDTEVPVELKTNRFLFFARVLGYTDSDVASLAVAEIVPSSGSLIPNHAIISFDEDGKVAFAGAGNVPKIDSDGPISVFSNNHLEVNGNQNEPQRTSPVAYYCGALTGSNDHPPTLFTGGLINKDKTQMLVSPFEDILNKNTIDSSETLQSAFEDAGFSFASYDYYYTDGQTNLYDEDGVRISRHNQAIGLNYNGSPRLVYINGNVDRNRNITIETGIDEGVGLVIINGNLDVGGNSGLNLQGILYATGDIEFGGTPQSTINGALWSEKSVWMHGTPGPVFQNTLAESSAPQGVSYSVRLKH